MHPIYEKNVNNVDKINSLKRKGVAKNFAYILFAYKGV